ncbi:hypothetical protein C8F04DRAFT_1392752 [Mycena alexandri]|uniref:F-box domain-containing protein n=1 Tax=Mycena alexandri TaxID=1745969 RepID=A0AAD6T5Q9_9AGAR|nr:hypothetical protein C8F04DRAFT_1392752 [Mycena alexandri]
MPAPATDIQSLSGDLLLLVFHELSVADVLCVRRVCRNFAATTRAKVLWMNLLSAVGSSEENVLPTCMKAPNLLDATALEALVVRVLRLARRWRNNDLFPVQVWRLNLCQSITWLRLVAGSWLFVASSDNYVSKITCWDMTLLFQNHMEPIAEAYLPGQVKTAQLEVQDSGIVIALGLGPSSPSVHIITLVQHLGTHHFAQLYRLEGSSHVLILQGDFIGCAVRCNTLIPHIINWKTQTTYDLPSPSGVDEPHFRNTPHSLILWNEFIVVVRHDTLHFYSQPTSAGPPVYTKFVKTIEIWELVVLDSRPSEPLRLLVISSIGVGIITIESDVLFNDDAYTHISVATTPKQWPWYRLTANGSGKRALWVSAEHAMRNTGKVEHPQLVYAAVFSRAPESETPLIQWMNDFPEDPALWAFPTIDFDEALGYTVVGNCFGELAIYDPIESDPSLCCRLTPDFSVHHQSLPQLLPVTPITLDFNLAPRRPMGQTISDRSLTSHWTQDDLALNPRFWCRDMLCDMYWDWDMWQGNLGDTAWLLSHAFGFPLLPIPQAHAYDDEADMPYVLVRSGERHLLLTHYRNPIQSFPLPLPRPLHSRLAERHQYLRPTAYTEILVQRSMFAADHRTSCRNRWREQQERGGRPHKNLLDTQTITQKYCIDI